VKISVKVLSKPSLLIIFVLIILSLVFPFSLLLPAPAKAEGGTFPASPFNGMQITYSISGATVTDTKDTGGFTTSRALKGTLGTGQLTISGSAKMGNGYDADVTATVSCGGKTDKFTTNIKSGFPDFNEESFNISVPIPKGATSGSFSINMTGHYNAGNRGLVVNGTFDAGTGASVPPSTQTSAPTQTEQDPPRDLLPKNSRMLILPKRDCALSKKLRGIPYIFQRIHLRFRHRRENGSRLCPVNILKQLRMPYLSTHTGLSGLLQEQKQ